MISIIDYLVWSDRNLFRKIFLLPLTTLDKVRMVFPVRINPRCKRETALAASVSSDTAGSCTTFLNNYFRPFSKSGRIKVIVGLVF
jgi:hypothetical protein